jgi:pimeloyl-ACP methyl ester carboxylesterase
MVGQKDVITLPENAKYIAEHMPNAKLKVIPEVGHCLPIEKPEEFNTEIMKFLVDSAHLIE